MQDFSSLHIFLLFLEIIGTMLALFLYATLILFLLRLGLSGWPIGKDLLTSFKNSAPAFIFDFLYFYKTGGWNQVTHSLAAGYGSGLGLLHWVVIYCTPVCN